MLLPPDIVSGPLHIALEILQSKNELRAESGRAAMNESIRVSFLAWFSEISRIFWGLAASMTMSEFSSDTQDP